LPSRFEASGLLVTGASPDPALDKSNHGTDIDILRSRALMDAVVNRLESSGQLANIATTEGQGALAALLSSVHHLLAKVGVGGTSRIATPAELSEVRVRDLLAHVGVSGNEDSRAFTITYRSVSPTAAAAVVNAVMAQYVALEQSAIQASSAALVQALSERAAAIEKQAEEADRRLAQFEAGHDVLSIEAGPTVTLQLNTQEAELAAARLDLAQAQAARDANHSGAVGGGPPSSRELQSSPVLQALAQRETEVLQRIADADNLDQNNPQLIALNDSLRAVRAQIAIETRKVRASLGTDVVAGRQRVAALEASVERARQAAQSAAEARLELDSLTRDATDKHSLYQSLLVRVEDARTNANQAATARIVSPAQPPLRPEPSRVPVLSAFACLGGMLLACAATLLGQLLSAKAISVRGLEEATGLPCAGSLPWFGKRGARVPDLSLDDAQSPLIETLRGIRLYLGERSDAHGGRVVLVTSADIGEGKTSLAAALARRAARDGLRVLLIEADLRRPSLRQLFDVTSGPSLETMLSSSYPLAPDLATDPRSGLQCLLSRGDHANPFSLLTSERFERLIAEARRTCDLIVIDSPPLLRVPDTIVLSRWADVTLFVVRAEDTSLSLVFEALKRVPEQAAARVATVLTNVRVNRHDPRGYYNGYSDRGPPRSRAILDTPRAGRPAVAGI
jgi:capsular exopolysaccharide synthesis family protein